jgi:dolichyl-phosphate beta-glucosyltransferase
VDDGGADFPAGEWMPSPNVHLLRLPHNKGKGAAVRAGMAIARGSVRVFTDVDLPYGPALIDSAVRYLLEHGYHVVIGDRSLPSSSYSKTLPAGRRIMSGLATTFIGRLVTGGFFDTQCGFKAIRADVAEAIFPLLRVNRFAFDVELVYVALLHRLDIKRVPVRLRRNETSTVRVVRDSLRAGADLLSIKLRQIRGRYDEPVLLQISQRDFERVHNGGEARAEAPVTSSPT